MRYVTMYALYMVRYMVTRDQYYLFIRFGGFQGCVAGLLVAWRQVAPEETSLLFTAALITVIRMCRNQGPGVCKERSSFGGLSLCQHSADDLNHVAPLRVSSSCQPLQQAPTSAATEIARGCAPGVGPKYTHTVQYELASCQHWCRASTRAL